MIMSWSFQLIFLYKISTHISVYSIYSIFYRLLASYICIYILYIYIIYIYIKPWGFPGGTRVKNLPANAGDTKNTVLVPQSGWSPGEGNSNQLQSSCLENPMDRVAWWTIVHGVTKNQTQLSEHTHACTHTMHFMMSLLSHTRSAYYISIFHMPYVFCPYHLCF